MFKKNTDSLIHKHMPCAQKRKQQDYQIHYFHKCIAEEYMLCLHLRLLSFSIWWENDFEILMEIVSIFYHFKFL